MNVNIKIASVVLASLMLFNTLYVALTYTYYYIDEGSFIELFCVNKEKPELKCNGKCHLKKVITETTNEDSQAPSRKIIFEEIVLFVEKPIQFQFLTFINNTSYQTEYSNLYDYLFQEQLYHPPRV